MRLFKMLALLCLLPLCAFAQSECDSFTFPNDDFEDYSSASCQNQDNRAFNDGCVTGWIAPHGKPNMLVNGNFLANYMGVSAYEGTNFAGVSATSQNASGPTNCLNSAIAVNLNLVPGREYEVFFYAKTAHEGNPQSMPTLPIDVSIRYTRNLTNSGTPGGDEICDDLIFASNSPQVYQESNFETDNWTLQSFSFTANSSNDQLVFYASQSKLGVSSYTTYWLLDNFQVEECDPCPANPSAAFSIDPDPAPGNNQSLDVVGYQTYDAPHTRNWIVYTSSEPNGPFSLYGEYQTNEFPIIVPEGVYYTIIHQLEVCGEEICYGQNHCSNCGKNFQGGNCDYCGVIENCELPIAEPPCSKDAPTGLDCEYVSGVGNVLNWTALNNVSGYEVRFSYNGSSGPWGLCSGNSFPAFSLTTQTNSIPRPSSLSSCYCWKVRSICKDGSLGQWSSSVCYDALAPACKIGPDPEPDPVKLRPTAGNGHDVLNVYPNPGTELFNIKWNGSSDPSTNVSVMDMTGKVIHSASANENSTYQWRPDVILPNGIYLIRVENGQQLLTKRVALQR
ncbi:hypothetical protein CEQ90_14205 [Lewinellaceae bacterium SD302]|nr:hypothetical protein CEQ90_14205 [Lewinellaceae bacterium SD302]